MSRATLHRRARSIPVTSVDSTGPTPDLIPVVCDICGWEGAPQREAWTAARAIARHQTSRRCRDVATGARPRDGRRTAEGCDVQAALAGTCTCPACTRAASDQGAPLDLGGQWVTGPHGVKTWRKA